MARRRRANLAVTPYADRQFHKWEKTVLWDTGEPYRPPCSFAPLVGTYVAAFCTAVVVAFTEQFYKARAPRLDTTTPPAPVCAGFVREVLDEMPRRSIGFGRTT
ncbi:hypothetical protein BRADI_4g32403v3 [Brachypodium distachyon]|uniref:Uncharacterized protein n=1 Tax=Brachypodium distachyon TaxID=15368 RepID=A0A0Q3HQU0_BRADI|nr:hypothetical protein BRADI_4g32403v3 [Brachypodium distachyon]